MKFYGIDMQGNFYVQEVSVAGVDPTWTAGDERRLIVVDDTVNLTDRVYIGGTNEGDWIEIPTFVSDYYHPINGLNTEPMTASQYTGNDAVHLRVTDKWLKLSDQDYLVAGESAGIKVELVDGSDSNDTTLYYDLDDALWKIDGSTIITESILSERDRTIHGLALSNDLVDDYELVISAGTTVVTDGAGDWIVATLPSTITKTLDNSYVFGDGNGGRKSVSLLPLNWYNVYLIVDTTGVSPVLDVMFLHESEDPSSNLPGTNTHYRRIGSVYHIFAEANEPNGIKKFNQIGDRFIFHGPSLAFEKPSIVNSEFTEPVVLPSIPVIGNMMIFLSDPHTGGADRNARIVGVMLDGSGPDIASYPVTINNGNIAFRCDSNHINSNSQMFNVVTDTATIELKFDANKGTDYNVRVLGYIDRRGQDD